MKILKRGTLRFWGEWFGRPYDNIHTVIDVYSNEENALVIVFDNGEKCTIYNPQNIVNNTREFYIEKATDIIWEWYYYGKEHTPENLCKIVYTLDGEDTVSVKYSGISKGDIDHKIKIQDYYALELC